MSSDRNVLNYFSRPGSGSDNTLNVLGSFYSNKVAKTMIVTTTLAQINAGATLIPGVSGKTITVVGYNAKVTGGFTTTTSVDVQSSNASPVKIAVNAVAGLTNGAIINETKANTTMGAGYLAALGSGDGVVVANVGTAAAGGTSITWKIDYLMS